MIRFSMKCPDGHVFDSWFQNGDAFEKLRESAMITCPECGTATRDKAVMAPRVRPSRDARHAAPVPDASEKSGKTDLTAPKSMAETELAALRKKIEGSSDYVGLSFASEARKMHDGDIPQRSIYGEAKMDEARKLLEDGVPVAPLPFIPKRKTN